jgi:very-short-patch-repair endonuclease
VKSIRDMEIARERGWYRIPQDSVEKWLRAVWPPRWLAFYQMAGFGRESYSVNWLAEVRDVRPAQRAELFPDEPRDERSGKLYQQLLLGPLQRRSAPLLCRRHRRIVFIPTTWEKFNAADEFNDLFDDSPLENQLWAALKSLRIAAERQEFIELPHGHAALDFAIYCARGQIDVETDGDTWHANSERAAEDNRRDNALQLQGWSILRFSSAQVNQNLHDCVRTIAAKIDRLGGLSAGGLVPRRIGLSANARNRQRGLFDDADEE